MARKYDPKIDGPKIGEIDLLETPHASLKQIEEIAENSAENEWTTVTHTKYGKTYEKKMNAMSSGPSEVFESFPKIDEKKSKKAFIKQRTADIMQKVEADKYLWEKKSPTKMAQKYVDAVEHSLGEFFHYGYVKNFNEGKPASNKEVVDFVKAAVIKYGMLISGGYLLKNMGFSDEGKSKPSVDCDIYVPHNIPDKFPEFYDEMARLFNCDVNKSGKFSIKHTITHKLHGNRSFFFRKNGIYSVFKHGRNIDNKGNESVNGKREIYAEMDLVRAASHMTPEKIVRGFDLSVCMNWYDGTNIYCMDEPAINKVAPGHLNYSYVPLVFGIKDEAGRVDVPNMTSRSRLLKYILRGYSFKYVDPRTGETHVFTTRDLANAVRELPVDKREKFYRSNPNERPMNMPVMNALVNVHQNSSRTMINNRGYMTRRHGRSLSPRVLSRSPSRSRSRGRSRSRSHSSNKNHSKKGKHVKRKTRSRARSETPFIGRFPSPRRNNSTKKYNNSNERENK
jgi:hypothetical protein